MARLISRKNIRYVSGKCRFYAKEDEEGGSAENCGDQIKVA